MKARIILIRWSNVSKSVIPPTWIFKEFVSNLYDDTPSYTIYQTDFSKNVLNEYKEMSNIYKMKLKIFN
jgi:hypothetical protein